MPERPYRKSFAVGVRVRYKNTPHVGTITDGPIMSGGDWVVLWDDAIVAAPEYNADLESLEPVMKEATMPAELHEHIPAIVHRSGDVSAEKLNACGLCGCWLTQKNGKWIEIDEQTADELRARN